MGVYRRVSRVAPNRVAVYEWNAGQEGNDALFRFQVQLYEGSYRLDYVYDQVDQLGFSATIGA